MAYFENFENFHFGFERILEVQLCSMEKPEGDDGYYFVEHSGEFCKSWILSDIFLNRTFKFYGLERRVALSRRILNPLGVKSCTARPFQILSDSYANACKHD